MIWLLQVILFFADGHMHTVDLTREYESRGECETARTKVTRALETIDAGAVTTFRTSCLAWRRDGN